MTLSGSPSGTDEIDLILVKLAEAGVGVSPLLLCFFTGAELPPYCAPMLRIPEPQHGMALDESFRQVLESALRVNPAIHDGAVMVGRLRSGQPYQVRGWSFRLFPPPGSVQDQPNRGSAFNSCLAMSSQAGIDRLYMVTKGKVMRFVRGRRNYLDVGDLNSWPPPVTSEAAP